jgi:hypothetical protein
VAGEVVSAVVFWASILLRLGSFGYNARLHSFVLYNIQFICHGHEAQALILPFECYLKCSEFHVIPCY